MTNFNDLSFRIDLLKVLIRIAVALESIAKAHDNTPTTP